MNSRTYSYEFYKQMKNQPNVKKEVFELLVLCDNEFVPSLSSRTSTTQNDLHNTVSSSNNGPMQYLNGLLSQCIILATDEHGKAVGFMSFKHNYKEHHFFSGVIAPTDTNNYISTICVHPNYRRFGIARQFYNYIESNLPQTFKATSVSTRTWSANEGHIQLLLNRNYAITCTIENHRELEDGTLVDTLYFCKKV